MNYLEHHLGDYAKRALSFSLLEHGAYSVLRDRYFTKELPIPAADVYRVASARSRDERAAVDAVLAEFYRLDGEAWRCDEFDAQLETARTKISAAQTNGKKGGRPKKQNPEITEQKPSGFSLGSISETQPKAHQTPDTNHQSPVLNTDTHTAPSTDGGRVCRLLRKAGVPDANPGHPDLLALIAAGASDAEFANAGRTAADKGKGFAYALGVLKGQRTEAAELSKRVHHGALAAPQSTDRKSRQLETAALMTGAARAEPQPETIDVDSRVIAPRLLG